MRARHEINVGSREALAAFAERGGEAGLVGRGVIIRHRHFYDETWGRRNASDFLNAN